MTKINDSMKNKIFVNELILKLEKIKDKVQPISII